MGYQRIAILVWFKHIGLTWIRLWMVLYLKRLVFSGFICTSFFRTNNYFDIYIIIIYIYDIIYLYIYDVYYIYDMINIYNYIYIYIYVHICSSHLRAEPRKPIMWTFHRSAKWSRCRHCFGACADVEGCASCGEVRWCSWKCRDAWVVHVRPIKGNWTSPRMVGKHRKIHRKMEVYPLVN